MIKRLLFAFAIILSYTNASATSGIFERYIILDFGVTNYVSGPSFNNQNLGTYSNTSNFVLKGGQIKTFKNSGDDITGATMFYRIRTTGDTTNVAFTSLNLPFDSNLPAMGDQLWQDNTQNILFTQGLANGYYDLEVYFTASFTYTGGSGTYTHIDNNGSINYKAHFTINSNINCAFNLGNDTTICGTTPLTILGPNATGTSYSWSNGSTTQSITVSTNGTYSLTTNNNGCTASDSIKVNFIAPTTFSLGNDVASCGAAGVTLNTSFSLAQIDDTLTITYDATQGSTQLVGSGRVYMHSGIKVNGGAYIWLGNWGLNDGVGQMDSLGNNLWRIKLNPKAYYGLNGVFTIDSLQIVFRNATGTATGKDNFGNNIKVKYGSNISAATSTFAGIALNKQAGTAQSILWSNTSTMPTLNVTTSGTYSVTVTTTCNFVYHDTINVTQQAIPIVNAGANQAICPGQSATFTAQNGFASYSWSNGATSQSITTNVDGDYILTAIDANGCSGIDLVNLTTTTEPTTSFTNVTNGATVTFTATCNMASPTFKWDFNNDGVIDSQTGPTVTHTFTQNGLYITKLITTVSCGDDTVQKLININIQGIDDVANRQFNIYPNPFSNELIVENTNENTLQSIDIISTLGQTVYVNNNVNNSKKITINTTDFNKGIYFIRTKSNGITSNKKLIKY